VGIIILAFVGYFAIAVGALVTVVGRVAMRLLWPAVADRPAVGCLLTIVGIVGGFCLGWAGLAGNAGSGFLWWGLYLEQLATLATGILLVAAGIVVVQAVFFPRGARGPAGGGRP
jgi:hypothetical protein